jgi:O-acetyl-ADP-ribose deacetylase (regulator of RNase III)
MIQIKTGSIWDTKCSYIVIPMNTAGSAGKGLAADLKSKAPNIFKVYKQFCKEKPLNPGEILHIYGLDDIGKDVILVITKQHWRSNSKIEWVAAGMRLIHSLIEGKLTGKVDAGHEGLRHRELDGIAIPALGCGAGQLSWKRILPIITQYTGDFTALDVEIYPPKEPEDSRNEKVDK